MLFAQLIKSKEGVRHFFDDFRMLKWWWSLILLLHSGKHVPKVKNEGRVIAGGFKVYACFYLIIAFCFLITGSLFLLLKAFYGVWFVAGAIFLSGVSYTGFKGVDVYLNNRKRGKAVLAVFVMGIVVFIFTYLNLFFAYLGDFTSINQLFYAPLCFALCAVGAGSYMLEFLYLVVD